MNEGSGKAGFFYAHILVTLRRLLLRTAVCPLKTCWLSFENMA
jgi:hypothetical protein